MKKDCYKLYDYSRNVKAADFDKVCPKDDKEVERSLSPQDSLLSIVYAKDEETGLPKGDLQYLVSDKANPEVKQFVLDNLMKDVSSAQNVAAKYNLSDDDILALSRNPNESIQDYANRLNTSIMRDKYIIQSSKQVEKLAEKPADVD